MVGGDDDVNDDDDGDDMIWYDEMMIWWYDVDANASKCKHTTNTANCKYMWSKAAKTAKTQ